MRSRSVFLEDGRRLFNLGTLAPEAIWGSVESDLNRLLGAFVLDDVQGITAAPLRQMTSEPAVDLTALSQEIATTVAPETTTAAMNTETNPAPPQNDAAADDLPAEASDVALADDAATLDPEHELNARLRDSGAGLVPRVIRVVTSKKYAVVAAAAIESLFHVPYGWHVIDDGKRTLVFDVKGNVQINLNLRTAAADEITTLLTSIGDELAAENPRALFLKLELLGMPCLAVRDLIIDGEQLDQAYLARPSHRPNLALVCRVTAARSEMTRAVNTAEVILMSLEGPPQ
jgi:hypothetical protein